MQALNDLFTSVSDPRQQSKVRHNLSEMLTVATLACLCGADNCCEIVEWGKDRLAWLKQYLILEHGIASHDTYSQILASIDTKQFAECFSQWTCHLLPALKAQGVVAIDGKTSRRTKSKHQSVLHLVSAFACEHHLVLGQEAVADKSNEKTAIPELLERLALQGCIVTIDAMGADKKIAKHITDKQADYILAIKDNQKHTKQSIEDFFDIFKENNNQDKTPHHYTQSIDKEKGAVMIRKCYVFDQIDCLYKKEQWANLTSFAVIINETHKACGDIHSQTRFYISSLTPNADQLLTAVRQHWLIENQLHWCMDIFFGDDLMRLRTKNAAQNMAMIKQLSLNLIRHDPHKPKVSIKSCRLKAAGNDEYRQRLVGW